MLSKTSYFNATLFRKNLTRFWPLWGMASFFGAIFPLALLVQVLQKEQLYNVVCVVTRYFGGILLGAGGLVRAYTKGTKIAIDAAGRSMKRVWSVLYLPCPYSFYERVKLEVAAFDGILRDTQFGAEVELEILIAQPKAQAFLNRIVDMTAGTVEGMEIAQEYRAFPIQKEEII